MISAPFDIAQKVKKNVFGSADDIRGPVDGKRRLRLSFHNYSDLSHLGSGDGASVGHSVFYTEHPTHITGSQSERYIFAFYEPIPHGRNVPTYA